MPQKLTPLLITTTSAIFLFAASLAHQALNLKVISLIALTIAAASILAIPTKWAIRIFFIYLGFEGLAKIVSGYHPIVHVGVDLLLVALVTKTLILIILKRTKKEFDFPPLTSLFFLHLIWFIITIANPYSLSLFASLAGAKVYVTMLLLFFFAFYLNENDMREVKIIMLIWVLVSVIHTVVGFYQAAIGPSSVTQIHPGYASALAKYEGRAFRPFGLTHVAGMPAIFIFLSTPFLIYFIISARSVILKVLYSMMIPAWFLMMFICQVRSALLKAIVGVGFFIGYFNYVSFFNMTKSSFKKMVLISVLIATVAISMPVVLSKAEGNLPDAIRAIERTMTLFDYEKVAASRRNILDRFLTYLKMAPLGAGLSRTGAASGKFSNLIHSPDDPFGPVFFADNFWIATLVDLGIPGMLLLSLIIIFVLYRGLKYVRRIHPLDTQYLYIAILSSLFACAIGMYGAEAMLYNPEAAFFWYFSGCLIRIQVDSIKSQGHPNG